MHAGSSPSSAAPSVDLAAPERCPGALCLLSEECAARQTASTPTRAALHSAERQGRRSDAHRVETTASATTDALSTVRSLVRPDTRCDTQPRLAPSSAQPRDDWSHRRASLGAVPLARAPLRCPPSRLQQPPPSSPSRLPVTSHPSCPCPTARAGGLPAASSAGHPLARLVRRGVVPVARGGAGRVRGGTGGGMLVKSGM